MPAQRNPHAGIVVKHRPAASPTRGARCNCKSAYQASVWSARDK